MKKLIKNLITRMLWTSIEKIVDTSLEDKLHIAVMFYVGDELIENRNMFVVPPIGSGVWVKNESKVFHVARMEIVSELGYEIWLYGKLTNN